VYVLASGMIQRLSHALPDKLLFLKLTLFTELGLARDFLFDVIFDHVQIQFLGIAAYNHPFAL
jgi:hypothetical protein